MKLYDYPGAPNPRRVKIFAHEKDINLELDDGRCISESIAICRYLESIVPEPNLFGEDSFEISYVESRNRHIELELWTQIGISWVNGPIVGSMGLFEQIPDAKKASDLNVAAYYKRLDREFSSSEYVAGDRYTVADITLLSAIDFASSMVDLTPDKSLKNLSRWHEQINSRPSSKL